MCDIKYYKTCRNCKEEKELKDFPCVNRTDTKGEIYLYYKTKCKECNKEYNKQAHKIYKKKKAINYCRGCRTSKPIADFDKNSKDDYFHKCKVCREEDKNEREKNLISNITHKICTGCEVEKETIEFSTYKRVSKKDKTVHYYYLNSRCKKCVAEYAINYKIKSGNYNRKCIICKEYKTAEEFDKNSNNKYYRKCRECNVDYQEVTVNKEEVAEFISRIKKKGSIELLEVTELIDLYNNIFGSNKSIMGDNGIRIMLLKLKEYSEN